jgi:hypothetical protein
MLHEDIVLALKDSHPMHFGLSTERNFVVSTDRIMLMLYTVAVLLVSCSRTLPTLQ